jgi:two-component system chemotaxis sensor kinase CheA
VFLTAKVKICVNPSIPRGISGISAATILGDGSVALIVDVSALQGLNREQRVAYTAA